MEKFLEVGAKLEDIYGIYFNREELFFICPECGELIDFEDYVVNGGFENCCPICESEWEIV